MILLKEHFTVLITRWCGETDGMQRSWSWETESRKIENFWGEEGWMQREGCLPITSCLVTPNPQLMLCLSDEHFYLRMITYLVQKVYVKGHRKAVTINIPSTYFILQKRMTDAVIFSKSSSDLWKSCMLGRWQEVQYNRSYDGVKLSESWMWRCNREEGCLNDWFVDLGMLL